MDGSELDDQRTSRSMSFFQSRIRIESDAFEHDVQLVEIDGRETISQLFEFDLLVTRGGAPFLPPALPGHADGPAHLPGRHLVLRQRDPPPLRVPAGRRVRGRRRPQLPGPLTGRPHGLRHSPL